MLTLCEYNDGQRMFAYQFDGYWKDVGTINSLWDANLDLLNPKIDLNLSDKNWRIYSRNSGMPPQYISEDAKVAARSIRRDANDAVKKSQKASEITEDDLAILEKDIQTLTEALEQL